MAEKLITIRKDPYDDMIFHFYLPYDKGKSTWHIATMHNDSLINLVPMRYIEELGNLELGETWRKKIRFLLWEEKKPEYATRTMETCSKCGKETHPGDMAEGGRTQCVWCFDNIKRED